MTCAICIVLDPALVGLSLVYAVSLNGMLQYAVRLSAEVDNLVGEIQKYLILLTFGLDGVSGKRNGLWGTKK